MRGRVAGPGRPWVRPGASGNGGGWESAGEEWGSASPSPEAGRPASAGTRRIGGNVTLYAGESECLKESAMGHLSSRSVIPVQEHLRDQVANALRAALTAGELRPGVVYSAPTLAAELGVSATPVREAMLDLAKEGLVEAVRNKGFRITEITDKDLDEYTEIRELIEAPTIARATVVATAEQLEALRPQALEIVEAARGHDLIGYLEADRRFHLGLLALAGNNHLVEVVSDLRKRSRLYGLNRLDSTGRLVDSAEEHIELLDLMLALRRRGCRGVHAAPPRPHPLAVGGRQGGADPAPRPAPGRRIVRTRGYGREPRVTPPAPGRPPARPCPTPVRSRTRGGARRPGPYRRRHRARPQPSRSVPIHSSTASAVRGSASDISRAPSAVITRSSSIRMPIPRSSDGSVSSSGWRYRPGSTVRTWPSSSTPSR